MRNFLIDTDTASDDAVAIIMALSEPSVKVLGLTTVAGNVDPKQATRNALLTAEICGSDAPVFPARTSRSPFRTSMRTGSTARTASAIANTPPRSEAGARTSTPSCASRRPSPASP